MADLLRAKVKMFVKRLKAGIVSMGGFELLRLAPYSA
jgi:hypothetical protein